MRNNRAMKKLIAPESEYVKTSLRLPPGVRDEVIATGKRNGRSMNDEILSRIIAADDRATLKQLVNQSDDLRRLMVEMLDQIELLK